MQFPIHQLYTAPEGSREILTQLVQKYGFLPNLAAAMAESPPFLKGYLAVMDAFDSAKTTLLPVERQVVLLAAATQNRCEYCAAAHGMLACKLGLERGDVDKIQQEQKLDDTRLEALRSFTADIVNEQGNVSDSALAMFMEAGFSRAQVLEVLLGVIAKTMTGYAHHMAKIPLNEQFSEYRPRWVISG